MQIKSFHENYMIGHAFEDSFIMQLPFAKINAWKDEDIIDEDVQKNSSELLT